jgi:hypothetical protein
MADDGAKQLVPFMQRADEVQRTHPRVAYYCALRRVAERALPPRLTRAAQAGCTRWRRG